MVCIYCSGKTSVTNSRFQKRNNQVWRRRKCRSCGAIFTTHEAILLEDSLSVERNGKTEKFLADKLYTEVLLAVQDLPDCYSVAKELTATITQNLLKHASEGLIKAQAISFETSSVLKRFNKRAWLRFVAEHPSVQPEK